MDDAEKLESLKKQLAEVASSQADTDYDAILGLSAEIARLDPHFVRFTSDAAVVRRLGRELVAKQETALAELVKNAYDADATRCEVKLIDDLLTLSMEISDDGVGMTRQQLIDGFMRLASGDKVQNPRSPKYGRKRAGKKGIGRFAAERLGRRLEIITQTEGAPEALRVRIDWDQFVQGDDLSAIKNSIHAISPHAHAGTWLTLEDLADPWTDAELKRVFRYVLTLQQPFGVDEGAKGRGRDPGFEVTFERDAPLLDYQYEVASAQSEVLGLALAVVEGEIDDTGQASWSLKSSRLKMDIPRELIGVDRDRRAPLQNARGVKLTAYYYIHTRKLLGRSTTVIADYMRENGGIKLYRNGYRVPPYGDRDDDWLGLDEAYARRTVLAPIANRNWLGAVEIDDPAGLLFEETSSRERLIENAAFREMQSVLSAILITAGQRIDSVREPEKQATREERERERGRRAAEAAEAARAVIARLVDEGAGADASPGTREAFENSAAAIDDALRFGEEVARERDALLEELNLLRILASMGLTVAEFTHDFSALSQTIELNLEELAEVIGDEAAPNIARLQRLFGLTRAYAGYFGSMMTSNSSRKLEAVDLYQMVNEFADAMHVLFDRRGFKLTIERPSDYDIFTVPMHSSEWSAILLNLLTNSIKASRRAGRAGDFLIRLGHEGSERVFLDFADNGDGIPEENRAKIFQPFFTTTPSPEARASDAAHALGTGLGLKIVSDTVDAVDGSVEVVDPPEGYVTCIRVSVPAGTPPEIEA